MTIGEIVGTLIHIHDNYELSSSEDDAVCAACNILDKLPASTDEETARQLLKHKDMVHS